MRELELAGYPSLDAMHAPAAPRGVRFKLSRMAFVVSVAVHVIAAYAMSRHGWPDASPPRAPLPDFFFELPRPRPTEPAVEPQPEATLPEEREAAPEEPRAPAPAPRAAEVVAPPVVVVEPSAAVAPPAELEPAPPPSVVDLDDARQRAAQEIVTERAAERAYMTFSIDDVAPPRPEAEPAPKRSIFDGGANSGGRSVGQVGQQRTKLGHKLVALCNALTGGFGVGFQGFGLFSACASPDDGPSGLFPEVRPAYLDMLPECVDTRDTAPALALEAPFPTIKCRMVRQDEPGE